MNIEPIHTEFGARISGIDLSKPLNDASFAEIDAAINRYSILSAYEVPDEAGETEFASGRAAYQRLGQQTCELIVGRQVIS